MIKTQNKINLLIMKKFLLSIFAVMLAVFSVQAQDVVLDFTTNDWGFPDSKQTTKQTFTNGEGYSITLVAPTAYAYYPNGNYLLFGKSEAVLTLPVFDFAVSKIEIVGRSGASTSVKEGLYAGDTKLTQFTGAAGTNAFEIPVANQAAGTVYSIKVESNHNAQITKINIYKAAAGGEEVVETVATPIITPETTTFNEGESVFVSIATETQDAEIYYTLDGTEPSTENGELYEGEIEITETTTVKAIAVKDGWNNSEVAEAKYTKTVVVEGGVVDVLNLALTGAEGTTYSSWSGKTSKSSAVYAGQSAGGNNAIQLRSSNSNSGIVTTQSGGKVKKISIDWNSNTAATRELWVYGKNTAYTNPTELYNASTDGDKLAEIACGTTEFIIEGDYEYIGLRSGSGAMYLNSIEITWVEEEPESYTLTVGETEWATLFLGFNAAIPSNVKAYTVTAVNDGYVTLTQVTGVLPAETGVIVNATKGNYEFNYSAENVADVAGNLLKGTVADKNIEGEAYVLGVVDGAVGLYKALASGTSWKNNANKAYLPASVASGAASYSFRFGEGTTAIENVEVENASNVIYDLTGRKVNEITAPGIYIVNGVKRVVR